MLIKNVSSSLINKNVNGFIYQLHQLAITKWLYPSEFEFKKMVFPTNTDLLKYFHCKLKNDLRI